MDVTFFQINLGSLCFLSCIKIFYTIFQLFILGFKTSPHPLQMIRRMLWHWNVFFGGGGVWNFTFREGELILLFPGWTCPLQRKSNEFKTHPPPVWWACPPVVLLIHLDRFGVTCWVSFIVVKRLDSFMVEPFSFCRTTSAYRIITQKEACVCSLTGGLMLVTYNTRARNLDHASMQMTMPGPAGTNRRPQWVHLKCIFYTQLEVTNVSPNRGYRELMSVTKVAVVNKQRVEEEEKKWTRREQRRWWRALNMLMHEDMLSWRFVSRGCFELKWTKQRGSALSSGFMLYSFHFIACRLRHRD